MARRHDEDPRRSCRARAANSRREEREQPPPIAMFAARQALRTTARVATRPLAAPARRPMSYDAFYKSALKSNMSQVTFVVAGAVIFEVVYGMGTEAMWSRANEGVRRRPPPRSGPRGSPRRARPAATLEPPRAETRRPGGLEQMGAPPRPAPARPHPADRASPRRPPTTTTTKTTTTRTRIKAAQPPPPRVEPACIGDPGRPEVFKTSAPDLASL